MAKVYLCPECKQPMRPHDGPWDIVHCVPCQKSCDLWYEQPEFVEMATTPHAYNPYHDMVVVHLRRDSGWTKLKRWGRGLIRSLTRDP